MMYHSIKQLLWLGVAVSAFLVVGDAAAEIVEIPGNITLAKNNSSTCVRVSVKSQELAAAVRELDTYKRGFWKCNKKNGCTTFYRLGKARQVKPGSCSGFPVGNVYQQANDTLYYDEDRRRLAIYLPNAIMNLVKPTEEDTMDMSEVAQGYQGFHVWAKGPPDQHAFADLAFFDSPPSDATDAEVMANLFISGVETGKIQGSWETGIQTNLSTTNTPLGVGYWDVPATLNAIGKLNINLMVQRLYGLKINPDVTAPSPIPGWINMEALAAEIVARGGYPNINLVAAGYAKHELGMDGTVDSYTKFIDEVKASQDSGLYPIKSVTFDDPQGDYCESLNSDFIDLNDPTTHPDCLTGAEVRSIADYARTKSLDYWHYAVHRRMGFEIVKSYIMGATSHPAIANANKAAFKGHILGPDPDHEDSISMGVTVNPNVNTQDMIVRLSFLFFDEYYAHLQEDDEPNWPYALNCQKNMALGVYYDSNGMYPYRDGTLLPLLENLHMDGSNNIKERRTDTGALLASSHHEPIELAKVDIDNFDPLKPTIAITLSLPSRTPNFYDTACIDDFVTNPQNGWRVFDAETFHNPTVHIWDIQVELVDLNGKVTKLTKGADFSIVYPEVSNPVRRPGLRATDSDTLDTRINDSVDGVFVTLSRYYDLYKPHFTSLQGPWANAVEAWNQADRERYLRVLASIRKAIAPAPCVVLQRSWIADQNELDEQNVFLDGEKIKIAYAKADGVINWHFPLTMYPSTDPVTGTLGTMMDQGSFAEFTGSMTYDQVALWRTDSTTQIKNWYQGFITQPLVVGGDYMYKYYENSTVGPLDRMTFRLLHNENVVRIKDAALSNYDQGEIIIPGVVPGDTISVEILLSKSVNQSLAWTDFKILDPEGQSVPMTIYTGAAPWVEDFYRCTANYWVSGDTSACVAR